ncbi:MAG: methyltransferase domain-containing protein [Gemmatimonadota bacterium]
MKRYTENQIRRTLLKYDLRQTGVEVANGTVLSMVETVDAYSLLDRLIERGDERYRTLRFPYWAEIWPASVALSRWLWSGRAPQPRAVALELGCGTGLVGVALARLGWQVESTDFVEDALIFAAHNARANRVEALHRVGYLDWSHPVGEPTDCIVASDVAYEKKSQPYLGRAVRRLLRPGGQLYISDPRRPASQPFLASLERQGYAHRVEQVEVHWRALGHVVDIHAFTRPPLPA